MDMQGLDIAVWSVTQYMLLDVNSSMIFYPQSEEPLKSLRVSDTHISL